MDANRVACRRVVTVRQPSVLQYSSTRRILPAGMERILLVILAGYTRLGGYVAAVWPVGSRVSNLLTTGPRKDDCVMLRTRGMHFRMKQTHSR